MTQMMTESSAKNEALLRDFLKKKEAKPNNRNENSGGAICASLSIARLIEVWNEALASNDRRDVNFGLTLQLGVCTGLRDRDLRYLQRLNLVSDQGKYFVEGVSSKMGKPYKKPISKNLYEALRNNAMESDEGYVFHNNGKQWERGWLTRRIQRSFTREYATALQDGKRTKRRITIGAHSLRKTYGMELYKAKGINAARIGLQHDSLNTTSKYLGVGLNEQIEIEESVFGGLV